MEWLVEDTNAKWQLGSDRAAVISQWLSWPSGLPASTQTEEPLLAAAGGGQRLRAVTLALPAHLVTVGDALD